MKERLKKILPILGIVCGAALFAAAFLLDDNIPKELGGVLFGTAGILMGLGATGIFMDAAWRKMSLSHRPGVGTDCAALCVSDGQYGPLGQADVRGERHDPEEDDKPFR